MKNSISKLLFGAWTVLAAGMFAACVDDNDENGMPFIEVNPETLVCSLDGNFEGGGNTFEVKSNRAWTLVAEAGSEWIEFEPKQGGEGNTKVQVSVPASNEGRVGTLIFQLANTYAVYLTKQVTVQQGEAPVEGPIAKLVAYIKENLASTSGEVSLNYSEPTVEGVILANNQYGNNFGKLYVGDNVNAPNSAIVLYDTGEFSKNNSAKYLVGKKVTLDLFSAKYAPYGNLRELKDVGVTVSDEEAVEVVVPTLTAAQFNTGDYQGQYVKVTGVTPQAEFVGQAWATDAKRTVKFDADGVEVQTYMAKASDAPEFGALRIAAKTGAIWGTAEQNFKNIQVIPTKPEDVLELTEGGDEPAVTTGAATAVAATSVTLSGSSRNIDNATEVGIAYKLDDATEVAWTTVPAKAVAAEWSVDVTGLTEGTSYMYYAYAKVGDAEPIKGETKTFKTKTISDADISIDFSDVASYPSDFPTSAQKELKTYSFAGYDFSFYGAESGYYKATYAGASYLMLGKEGAYLELPAVAGKSLTKVIIKSREGSSKNVRVSVCDTSNAPVAGGEEQQWNNTTDYTYVYTLSGTAINTPYRLNITNNYNAQITQLDLYYTEGGAIALAPKTAELTFEPNETAAKTVEYTFDAEIGSLTVAIDSDQYFTAELDADGKTVKVTPKSANDSNAARTATVTVTLTDKTDATRTATATIAVTQASASPQTIADVIAGGAGKDAFVEGVIVAKHTQGFVLKDDTGMLYIYLKSETSQNIGDKVQVKGTTDVYNGLSQIKNPAVTLVATGSYEQPTPEQMDGTAIEAYLNQESLPIKYVQYKGVLTNSGKYYNVVIDGTTTVQGSIQNPPAGLIDPAIIGAPVVVTGYTVGMSKSGDNKYFNTMATSVVVDSSASATITEVDPSSLSWANDETAAKTVTVKGINLNEITCTLSGAASSHFTVTKGTPSTTGAITTIELTVTPTAANTGADGITETLTVQATGGNSQKEIVLTHKAPLLGNVGEPYSWTLANGDLGTSASVAASVKKGTPEMTWTFTPTWKGEAYLGWDSNNNKGLQIGSSKKSATSIVLSTTEYTGNVVKVAVNMSGASGINATLQVSVGSTVLKCSGSDSATLTAAATEFVFESDSAVSGAITLTWTNSSEKAIYVKQISVNPAE